MLFRIIPERLIDNVNNSALIVTFKNGSILQLKGAQDPDSLRGAGPVGIVLDEFATMKIDAWPILEPILRENGGWCWFIGTPKGKNHLYHLYLKGKSGIPEWNSWLLRADKSSIIDPEQLENSRASMSQTLFNQEWLCEFMEGVGSVFRSVREAATAVPMPPEPGHLYVMGVDLAKAQDWSVLAVYDRATNAQVYQDRFQQLEWPFQKRKIATIAKHYNNALIVPDATGLGDPIADDLVRSGLSVAPFKITQQSKKDIIEKLSIWIEQRRVKLLPIQHTIDELESFSYEVGPTGAVRYGAPNGLHDDIVIAHSLAISALSPLYNTAVIRPTNRIAEDYARKKEAFMNEGLNDYENF